jgi:predicted ATPase
MLRLLGDTEAAWPHAEAAFRISERGSFGVWLAHAWMVRGQLRADRGDPAGGDVDMDTGYRMWVGSGARISCATYLVTRAEILLRQGRSESALHELRLAWSISEEIGEHYYQAELLRLQGLCAWQRDQPTEAAALLTQGLRRAEDQGKPGLALRCALSLGALQAAVGQFADATATLASRLAPLAFHQSCRDSRWARHALERWGRHAQFDHLPATPWEPR